MRYPTNLPTIAMFNNSASAPRFQAAVFFVKDVERSKRFYTDVLGQKVTMDFGANVTFEGGLSIWRTDYALNIIFKGKAKQVQVELTTLKSTSNAGASTPSLSG